MADLGNNVGCEQNGERPVLIIQNNMGNLHSPTVIAASITSRQDKAPLPTHVFLPAGEGGLVANSILMAEQVRTIDKSRLKGYMGHLNKDYMKQADRAIGVSFALPVKVKD